MFEIECPSGLKFEAARTWKLGDRRILLDKGIVSSGRLLHKMLGAVFGKLIDPGPYTFRGTGLDWERVCNSDIISAAIDVRAATRPKFGFNTVCEHCPTTMPLEVNLRDLERVPMSEEGKKHLRDGTVIERIYQHREYETDDPSEEGTPSGPQVKLKLRLLTGKDHVTLMKFQKEEDDAGMIEVQNCYHIVEMQAEGEDVWTHNVHFKQIRDFYRASDWDFQESLDKLVEEISGGPKTEIEVFCKSCKAEQVKLLPFTQDFFIPRKKQRSSFSRVS